MASAQQKFWKLVIDSRLLPLEECQRLHGDFCRSTQAPPDDATALARWLIAEGVLTRYQARVLLAGKAGPFRLADYTILDRHGDGQIKGVYQATSRTSGERAVLLVVPASAAADQARLEAMARKVQKAIATGAERMKPALGWRRQGSLAFTVLAELSPAAVAPSSPPPRLPTPAERNVEPAPEQPAEEWAPDNIPAFQSRRKRRHWGPALVGWGVGLGLIGAAGWAWYTVMRPAESDTLGRAP